MYMRKAIIPVFGVVACIFTILSIGCATGPAGEATYSPLPPDNRLVIYNVGMSLPSGWRFTLEEDPAVLFSFRDDTGIYRGSLEWCEVGFSPTEREIQRYIQKNLPAGLTAVDSGRYSGEKGDFFVMRCMQDDQPLVCCLGLIPGEIGFFVLELLPKNESPEELVSLCSSIAGTVGIEPDGFSSRRIIADSFVFNKIAGDWDWFRDSTRGSIFYRFLTGYSPCVMGIFETEAANIEDLYSEGVQYSAFDAEIIVNNRPITVAAAGRILDRQTEAMFLLKGKRRYLIHCTVENKTTVFDPAELLEKEEIQSFFLSAITFEGL